MFFAEILKQIKKIKKTMEVAEGQALQVDQGIAKIELYLYESHYIEISKISFEILFYL